jgi:5-methyltetrahydrofolate--homocysteine methyltransferase
VDFLAETKRRTLLFDGAMGTQLIAAGYRSQECPEEWNVSNADVVADIHRAYFAAGADIVQTNTFGGSRAKLGAYHCAERTQEFNLAAAHIATAVRDEVGPGKLVAGEISSSGVLLKPLGDGDPRELRDVFAEQAEALAQGGVDLFSIETMFDLEEAKAAVSGVRAVSNLPVMATLTFKSSPKGFRTMMGTSPAQAAAALLELGADLVGANCSITAEEMLPLVDEFRAATQAPLIFQPNAGQPRLEGGHTTYDETPAHFAEVTAGFSDKGVAVVGGCCGTTPAHISALAAALR